MSPQAQGFQLSPQQQRLWRLQQASQVYRAQSAICLEGALDAEALRQAFAQLAARHEIVRTVFRRTARMALPLQVVLDSSMLVCRDVDLSAMRPEEQAAAIERLFEEEQRNPFDFEHGPLCRMSLLSLSARRHVALVSLPALCADAWTLKNIARDLSRTYAAILAGDDTRGAVAQYVEFSEWQHELLAEQDAEKGVAYWGTYDGADLARSTVPFGRAVCEPAQFAPRSLSTRLEPALVAQIEAISRQHNTSAAVFLFACWQTLLRRLSGQPEILTGYVCDGRTVEELHDALGLFAKWVPIRCRFEDTAQFDDILRLMADATAAAEEWQEYFVLDQAAKTADGVAEPAFFATGFGFEERFAGEQAAGVTFSVVRQYSVFERFAINLACTYADGGLIAEFYYDSALFAEEDVARLAENFQTLVASAVAQPAARIDALAIVGPVERQQLLVDFNAAKIDYPREQLMNQLFEQQAAQTPDRIALVFDDLTTNDRRRMTNDEDLRSDPQHPTPTTQYMTYAELNARANQLAHYLRGLGVEPDVRVGLCVERSLELAVGLLGVLKAGGTYVPLDPAYPQERLAFMVDDSQAPILLTQQRLAAELPNSLAALICLDGDWALIAGESADNPASVARPDNLAYIIYTSGSTGRPKGVLVTHRNLLHSTWARLVYPWEQVDSFLWISSFAFDSSVVGFYWTLCRGGALVIPQPGLERDLQHHLDLLIRHRVSHFLSSPSLYLLFLAQVRPEQRVELRTVIVAGEACPVELVERHDALFPATALFNEYGPTEGTVWSTVYDCRAVGQRAVVPIGRPLANVQVYLLDAALQPVPIGVMGELYIGGEGIARGYLNRPDLTAERFIPNPFAQDTETRRHGDRETGDTEIREASQHSAFCILHSAFGTRLYRTGDLARFSADGTIEFVGRVDQQVKLRGYRIELSEIEATLRRHSGVLDSVVVVWEAAPGDSRLVAYVVPQAKRRVDRPLVPELRAFLQTQLPEYMLPALFVPLQALPLTTHGKVDYRALPAPETALVAAESTYVAPRNPVEEVLAQIWADVLRLERVGIRDQFFDSGGHSLLGTQVVSRVLEVFQVEVPLRDLFEAPTVEGFAERVAAARQDGRWMPPPLLPVTRDGVLPLSFAQQRLWFLDQLEPNSAIYIIPTAVRLSGPLDLAALGQSLSAIVERHEVLRTTFAAVDGQPAQMIAAVRPVLLPLIDLQSLAEEAREAAVLRLVAVEAQRPFDLARGPLLRALVLRVAAVEHVVLLTMHHIVSDAWSSGVFIRELTALYAGFALGQPAALPELPVQYADFTIWQRQWLQGEALAAQLEYWRRQLAAVPPLDLPTDYGRPAIPTFRGATQPFALSMALGAELLALSRHEGVTLFMTLLAAWQVLLARYSGQADVAIGTPIAGRTRHETEGLIGCFINTLVLRTDLEGDPTFREVLRRVREVCLDAYAHQNLPFDQVVEAVQPARDLSRHPLFQVFFALQNTPPGAVDLPGVGLVMRQLPIAQQATQFDLSLSLAEAEAGLIGALEYRTDLFEPATITRMLGHFQTVLAEVAGQPNLRMADLVLLSAAEREQALVEWNATAADYPRDRCVHQLFEEQAARTPDAVAVVFDRRGEDKEARRQGDKEKGRPDSAQGRSPQSSVLSSEQFTYHELNVRANQLARYLRGQGVGPEVLVGLYTERSPELLIGLLGVLKAGGAYLPLDPDYPAERLAFMLADAQALVLITTTAGSETRGHGDTEPDRLLVSRSSGFRASQLVVDLRSDWPTIACGNGDNLTAVVRSANAAYVIYTSGSTGRPKGVLVSHQALVNYTRAAVQQFGLRGEDRVLQFAALGFDVVAEELFPTWASGATVVLHGEQLLSPADTFPRLLDQARVTAVELPAAYWHVWVDELERGGAVPSSLRLVLLGCEKPSPARLAAWQRWGVAVIYVFGLTETTITSTLYQLPAGAAGRLDLPIGRPVANTQAYVLDAELQPAPIGVAGELYIGGDGLARGYLGRPDLTADRFIPNPFAGDTETGRRGDTETRRPGDTELRDEITTQSSVLSPQSSSRLYRTGDLARYRADGNIEFLGRRDEQVKLRGFRVELGEIAATLLQHPAVRESAVVARADAPGEPQLVAYVGLRTESKGVSAAEPTTLPDSVLSPQSSVLSALRTFLAERLPAYMVPAAFVVLDALPLTPNGKLDRRALPRPETPLSAQLDGLAEPRTPVEEVLARIWADVLRLERVGVHDDFFGLGGHSLLAVQLIARVREVFQVELSLRRLFTAPTVAELAVQIVAARRDGLETPPPPLTPVPRDGALPLSFAQQRLWFLDQLQPDSPAYNVPAAMRMAGALDLAALSRSLSAMVARHESLRTTFALVDGRPVQVIARDHSARLRVLDLQALPEREREATTRQLAAEEARRPFDLARGPLLRTTLLRLGPREHVVLLTMHHIISDAWSMEVFVREVGSLYSAFAAGRLPALPALPIQYADYAVWQRGWLQDGVLEAQLAYWREQLADLPLLALPTDRPRPPVASFQGAGRAFVLPSELSAQLVALSHQAGVTLFMLLLAAFQTLLARYSGQDDVVVGTPIANRAQSETAGLIGFFLNTLVLRADLRGDPSFLEALRRVREMCLDAYAHQEAPFEQVVDDLQPERDLSRHPLFQVVFVLEHAPTQSIVLPELTMQPLAIAGTTMKFDLALSLTEGAGGLAGALEYSTDLFEPTTIEQLLRHFQMLLEGIAAAPERRLADLPLLDEAERRQLLVEWNTTAAPELSDACIHQRFAAQAALRPDAVALVFDNRPSTGGETRRPGDQETGRPGDRETENDAHTQSSPLSPRSSVLSPEHLTYHELNVRANQLARHLRRRGVGPEVRVALCLERSPELIVSVLAVLAAGGAYLPLDPAYPQQRLTFLLADSQPTVLLTQRAISDFRFPISDLEGSDKQTRDYAQPVTPTPQPLVICLDRDWEQIARHDGGTLTDTLRPDNLAYVIYTSGSTGQPKGVLVPHRGLGNLATAQIHAFDVRPDSRVLQFAALSFDAAVSEIAMALLSGATLVLAAQDALLPGPELLALLDQQRITTVTLPPAVLAVLAATDVPALSTLVVAGEACPAPLLARWAAGRRVFNAYGPTETTVCATLDRCQDDGRDPPIGRPLPQIQVYLLDRHLQPVPLGVTGELCVSGVGVARGYLNRPDLTAERFVPNPFSADRETRRPGDRETRRPRTTLTILHSAFCILHSPPGCTEPATWRAICRMAGWCIWDGATSKSSCAASGSSWARSPRRCASIRRCARRWCCCARTYPASAGWWPTSE